MRYFEVMVNPQSFIKSGELRFSIKAKDFKAAAAAALDRVPAEATTVWLKIVEREFIDAEANHEGV